MGARYPFYLLADSREGQVKEAEIIRSVPSIQPTHDDIRHGFVYERVPHITLKSIASNAEIDVIWEKWQKTLEPLREQLNKALKQSWQEWEIPREPGDHWRQTDQEIFYSLKAEIAKGKDGNPATIREGLQALNANLKRSYTAKTLPDHPLDPGPKSPPNSTRRGGTPASPARRTLTPLYRPKPNLNSSTTNLTRTETRSASPARSPSKASPRTAS